MANSIPETTSRLNFGFWAWWVLVNLIGGMLGLILSVIAFFMFGSLFFADYSRLANPDDVQSMAVLSLFLGIITGSVTGFLQGIFFHINIRGWRTSSWVRLSTLGGGLGFICVLSRPIELLRAVAERNFVAISIPFVVGGAVLGTAQYLALRRNVPNAGWWIAINSAAWLASALMLYTLWDILSYKGDSDPLPSPAILLQYCLLPMLLTLPAAILTGIGLVWLLRTHYGIPSRTLSQSPHSAPPN